MYLPKSHLWHRSRAQGDQILNAALLYRWLFSAFSKTLLKLDPYCFTPLAQYQHRTLCISIDRIGSLVFHVDAQALVLDEIHTQNNDRPYDGYDCLLRGSLSGLLDIIFKYQQWIPGQGLIIQGNTKLAQALFDCFKQFDPDLLYALERYFPSPLLMLLSQISEPIKTEFKQWREHNTNNLRRYLIDEINVLPSRAAVNAFQQEMMQLQYDIERLEQDIQHILKPSEIVLT